MRRMRPNIELINFGEIRDGYAYLDKPLVLLPNSLYLLEISTKDSQGQDSNHPDNLSFQNLFKAPDLNDFDERNNVKIVLNQNDYYLPGIGAYAEGLIQIIMSLILTSESSKLPKKTITLENGDNKSFEIHYNDVIFPGNTCKIYKVL